MKLAPTPSELADELESGRWRKARGQLARTGNRRCCLGVFCEMRGLTVTDRDEEEGAHYVSPEMLCLHYVSPEMLCLQGLYARGAGRPAMDVKRGTWLTLAIEDEMVHLNDNRRGWGDVIEYLRELDEEV